MKSKEEVLADIAKETDVNRVLFLRRALATVSLSPDLVLNQREIVSNKIESLRRREQEFVDIKAAEMRTTPNSIKGMKMYRDFMSSLGEENGKVMAQKSIMDYIFAT
jgi:hypothetical protein